MLAVPSGQVRAIAGGRLEAPSADPLSRRTVAAAIGHGLLVGAAATLLQLLLFLALLLACGVLAL